MHPRDFTQLIEDAAILTDQSKQELAKLGYKPMGRIDLSLSDAQQAAEMRSWKDSYGGRCKFTKDGDHLAVMVQPKSE